MWHTVYEEESTDEEKEVLTISPQSQYHSNHSNQSTSGMVPTNSNSSEHQSGNNHLGHVQGNDHTNSENHSDFETSSNQSSSGQQPSKNQQWNARMYWGKYQSHSGQVSREADLREERSDTDHWDRTENKD